jgi:hypothetical protein
VVGEVVGEVVSRGEGKSDELSVEGGRRGTTQQQEAHLRYVKTVRDMIAGMVQQQQQQECDKEEQEQQSSNSSNGASEF